MKPFVLLATAFLLTTITAWANDSELESAQESALSWLTLTDSGQFETSWNAASTLFKAAISESDLMQSLNAVGSSFGALKAREIVAATFSKTLSGAPNGRYVVFQFDTSYEKQASATETLSLIKDGDDVWRVAAYIIK